MAALKWRGVPIAELDDETLETAFYQATKIVAALVAELAKRGFWSKEGRGRD